MPTPTDTPMPTPTDTPMPTPTDTPMPTPTDTPAAVANDLRQNPFLISTLPFHETRNVMAATTSADDPQIGCVGGTGNASVWYSVVPMLPGSLNVTTAGSSYDTAVAVWSLDQQSSTITMVACSLGDVNGNLQANLTLVVNNGQTYWIEVVDESSTSSTTRNLTLNVSGVSLR